MRLISMLVARGFAAVLVLAPICAAGQPALPAADARQQANELVRQAEAAVDARDTAKAIALYEKALELRKAALGGEHPQLVPILDALGALHRSSKNYTRALAYFEQSLSIDEKTRGPQHSDVAVDLKNIAEIHEALGNHEKARELRDRSRAIERTVRAPGAEKKAAEKSAAAEERRASERAGNEAMLRKSQELSQAARQTTIAQARQQQEAQARQQMHRQQQAESAAYERSASAKQKSEQIAMRSVPAPAPSAAEPSRPRAVAAAAPARADTCPEAPLPHLPWPPPEPSTRMILSNSMFPAQAARTTVLSSVAARLVAALEQARYFEYSYYRAPNGFALVARLERIDTDGTPLPEDFRFLAPGSQEPFSLGVYIRELFFAPAGFYRQIVFTVTDESFVAGGRKLDSQGAQRLLACGANRLTSDYDTLPFTPRHVVTALIYEFRKGLKEGDVSTLSAPGRLGARTHLDRAGIYRALAQSQ